MSKMNKQIVKMLMAKNKKRRLIPWDFDSDGENIYDFSHIVMFGTTDQVDETEYLSIRISTMFLSEMVNYYRNIGVSDIYLKLKKDHPLILEGSDEFIKLDFKGYIAPKIEEEDEE